MITPDQVSQLQDHVGSASSILVLLGKDPKSDHVLTAAALAQVLVAMGKSVELGCPDELALTDVGVVGELECRQKLGNQNLSISFDYDETTVDKVSYHIDEDQRKFFLIVKPQKGYAPLTTESVTFDYTGADADLIFLVGVHQFDALEHLYEGYEDLFSHATVITLHTFEPQIGNLKLNLSGTSSMSESAAQFLLQLNPALPADAATNLLTGIEQGTDHFQSLTATAMTFETVAELMKVGARRIRTNRVVGGRGEGKAVTSEERSKQTEVVLRQEKTSPFSQALSKKGAKGQKGGGPGQRTKGQTFARPTGSTANAVTEEQTAEPKPGDLRYQPSGFGPGGTG